MIKISERQQEAFIKFLIAIMLLLGIKVWQATNDPHLATKVFVGCGILLLIIFLGIGLTIKNKKDKKLINSGIDGVDKMTGLGFERFVLAHFEKSGYKGELTSTSNDYGADLVLKKDGFKTVVQAKRWKGNIGIKAVQEIVGAINYYGASKGMVITNSYFTSNAESLAKANNIELWDRNMLIEIMLKNQGKELSETVIHEVYKTTSYVKNTNGYCPNCGSQLIERNGKKGLFIGCSNFPKCRFTKDIADKAKV